MTFDYTKIPNGFYDKILIDKNSMRKFWHWHKFDSVKRSLSFNKNDHFLDVGCFCGSMIGRFLPQENISAVGIDILSDQIDYATKHFGNERNQFITISDFQNAQEQLKGRFFDKVTCIEVIEHLEKRQIAILFDFLRSITKLGSEIIITTPNYFSIWPLLEIIINNFSDVNYEEQHLTKFNFFSLEKKLKKIYPDLFSHFEICFKTTSHFITPFIAALSYASALKLSASIDPLHWKNPFGCLIVVKLRRL